MKRVIIESPYAGNVQHNLWYLWACLRDSLLRGEAPFASHAFYTLPMVLDDTVPAERNLGMEAGFVWRHVAELTAVYTDLGMSKGMHLGVNHARDNGIPVEYRTIPGWMEALNERS